MMARWVRDLQDKLTYGPINDPQNARILMRNLIRYINELENRNSINIEIIKAADKHVKLRTQQTLIELERALRML